MVVAVILCWWSISVLDFHLFGVVLCYEAEYRGLRKHAVVFYVHRTGLLLLRASDGDDRLDDGVCICDAHV